VESVKERKVNISPGGSLRVTRYRGEDGRGIVDEESGRCKEEKRRIEW
jgi:hypothetical protein